VEKLQVRCIETSSYGTVADTTFDTPPASSCEPAYSLPLCEIDIQIGGKIIEAGVIDPGSQIIIMWADLVQEVGANINADWLLQMEGANGATNWTLGCVKYLPMYTGNISFLVHAHVMEHAPF
jgi:hypothetical protein